MIIAEAVGTYCPAVGFAGAEPAKKAANPAPEHWRKPMVNRHAEEQLDLAEIQGDIVVGLQKKVETFVGFAILDVAKFKAFLKGLHLTSARDALIAQRKIDAYKAAGGATLLDIRGVNVAFSFDGLKKLGVAGLDQITDTAFKQGLAVRSQQLGDPVNGDGAPANWRVGNGVGQLDGLLIITGRGVPEVAAILHDLDQAAGQGAWLPFYVETGNNRPGNQDGHEHFGFLDGVSQPSVRGRIDSVFPDADFLNPTRSQDPNQGLPGSDLHWPGEFVFGYAEQSETNVEQFNGPKQGGLPWMRNGSYMVFRRLEQLVPEFHATVAKKAAAMGQSKDVLEARIVGRFPHGAPLIGNANGDDLALGADELRNNHFEFGPADVTGTVCPYAGHIRKAYPRNDITPASVGAAPGADLNAISEADTQTHRIMRRGIPFGREVTLSEGQTKTSSASRGLMFVCYQTEITDQFEFITKNWVNNPDFAIPGAGHDIILGQAGGAHRQRFMTGLADATPSGKPPNTTFDQDFVRPTGGGYFFMPSISAVQSVLSASSAAPAAAAMPHAMGISPPERIPVPAAKA